MHRRAVLNEYDIARGAGFRYNRRHACRSLALYPLDRAAHWRSLLACAPSSCATPRGCAPLPPAQRLNRFPAAPMCSIIWTVAGELEAAAPGLSLARRAHAARAVRRPPFVSAGQLQPRARAFVRRDVLSGRAACLDWHSDGCLCWTSFAPWARCSIADWLALSDAVLAAPDDAARVRLVENFLAPRWAVARKSGDHPAGAVRDWVRRLGVQAASTGLASSARNIERRIKAWAGQPMRTLRRMRRAEQLFLDERGAILQGTASSSQRRRPAAVTPTRRISAARRAKSRA